MTSLRRHVPAGNLALPTCPPPPTPQYSKPCPPPTIFLTFLRLCKKFYYFFAMNVMDQIILRYISSLYFSLCDETVLVRHFYKGGHHSLASACFRERQPPFKVRSNLNGKYACRRNIVSLSESILSFKS